MLKVNVSKDAVNQKKKPLELQAPCLVQLDTIEMMEVISFQKALERSGKADKNLLLGNGFSNQHFNYKNLLSETSLGKEAPLYKLFKALDTFDFETVIRSLEEAAVVEKTYSNLKQSAQFVTDAQKLREELVLAVRKTHPANRGDLEDKYPSCIEFLKPFSKVFTLNYDLLLYWVLLNVKGFNDGFGLGEERDGFRGPFKENAYCNTYNLHGGLHLFQTEIGDVEKRLMGVTGVIDAIASTITDEKRLPLYVAEGTWKKKLAKINSISYLRHCLGELKITEGALFIFGHSAAENDTHIYNTIFASDAEHIYFSVHQPDNEKLKHFDGQLSRYQKFSGSKIKYTFMDAETAQVWPVGD